MARERTGSACSRTARVRYVTQAGQPKKGCCHPMATLMLERGADIRFIAQMLGDFKLTTAEVYTQVSLKKSN